MIGVAALGLVFGWIVAMNMIPAVARPKSSAAVLRVFLVNLVLLGSMFGLAWLEFGNPGIVTAITGAGAGYSVGAVVWTIWRGSSAHRA
jgi:hypothetical protein